MKRYVFEVKTFLTIKARSEDEARDKLDYLLGDSRHDVPHLVNVIDDLPRKRCAGLDLSDTGIANRLGR